MCTAIRFNERYFGRTLDFERSFGEQMVVTPRERMPLLESTNRYGMMGVGKLFGDTPLYFDGVNEWGLAAAALNFPSLAHYCSGFSEGTVIPSGRLVSYALGLCRSVYEVREMLGRITVSDEGVGGMAATPLHWIFADGRECITVEAVESGLMIYDNPVGVLTNAPGFDYHLTRLSDFPHLSPRNPAPTPNRQAPYSRGMGGIGLPGDFSSSSRFVRAAFLKEWCFGGRSSDVSQIGTAFSVLENLAIPAGAVMSEQNLPVITRYTALIDLAEPTYYITTDSCHSILRLSLSDSLLSGGEIVTREIYREEKLTDII